MDNAVIKRLWIQKKKSSATHYEWLNFWKQNRLPKFIALNIYIKGTILFKIFEENGGEY